MRSKQKYLQGTIKRHPDGFGFFIPESKEHPDVYIPKNNMKGIFTNDKVMVEPFAEGNTGRFRGEIISVVSRGVLKVAGTLLRLNDKFAVIRDDGGNWGEDLKIPWDKAGNSGIGKLVTAQITQYPENGNQFEGEVLEVLGDVADPMNDVKRVIAIQQIPDVFPDEVIHQVKSYNPNPSQADFADRVDLRGKNLITIDGKTAKDFDDAILVEHHKNGFKLYVAIADVSHYVIPDTPLDKEAYLRGNSVYFPNFVVPMLPEILSNHLCSLNPKVPRLCVVAEMDFDYQGQKTGAKFYEGVMESKARVTYGEAQEIIDGTDIPAFAHVKENILLAADLAKILMAKRFREGSLDLEIPETELIIDAKGEPVDVIRSERLFSHRLIEEMMLAANVATAEFFNAKDIPAIYRIHEPPFEDSIEKLQNFIISFGGKITLDSGQLQKRISRALEEFAGTPQASALHTMTLRSMNQAKYSADNRGHFGLGFENYTHFTSPIRRYSDLVVHRLLKSLILPNSRYKLIAEDDLASAGTHLSATEQKAAKAERLIKAIKKARFMGRFLGEEFEGMISSVTKFGVFVVLREYDIDGLVRIEDLSRERLEFDEENLTLTNKRSGLSYQIGDTLKIIVASVDIEQGQINFIIDPALSKAASASGGRGRRSPQNEKRGRDSGRGRPREKEVAASADSGPARGGRRDSKGRGGKGSRRKSEPATAVASETREQRSGFSRGSKKNSRGKTGKSRAGSEDNQSSRPTSRPSAARGTRAPDRSIYKDAEKKSGPRSNVRFDDPSETRSARRPGEGLSPEQVEEKLRKLAGDPRFQKRSGQSSPSQGRNTPKTTHSRSLFERITGRNKDPDKEQRRGASADDQSPRKNSEKRGKASDDRGRVRKARVPKSR